jgi:C4-dicarboxylate transporter DctM subunit
MQEGRQNTMLIELLPVVIILIVILMLNMPIWIALLASTIYMQVFINQMPLQNIVSGMFEGITKSSLLAIPFFILCGALMAGGTLGGRLVNVFEVFFSRFKSGLALSCLISNAVFGAISGSPPAATATFGKIMYKPMSEKYNPRLSMGLITSAASLSAIIPPSISMIVYGVVAETSIATMFIAGIIPGIVIVVLIGIYLVFICRNGELAHKSTGKEKKEALKKGIPVLVLPVLILGGIYGGVFTPSEAGAVGAVYAAIISIFVMKDMNVKKSLEVLKSAAVLTIQVMILLSCSSVFAQAITITQAPQALSKVFENIPTIAFLLMLNVLLLILGFFIDSLSAILVFVPLLMPTAVALGINPIHFGMIFVVNLAMGMFTPPFGFNLFVAQGVFNKDIWYIARGCLPFIILYAVGVILVTYIPALSLFLPSIL